MITLNSVSRTYGWRHRRALNDVSLSLPDAGVVALVGPEGAGKTTLMQILAGLTAPSSGTVSMDGRALPAREALGRAMMVSPSQYFGELFGSSLVKYAQLRPAWDQGLFDQYLERFELNPVLLHWKAVRRFSRAQIAVLMGSIALASGAPITLLDEIQAPLDEAAREGFFEEIRTLAAEAAAGRRPRRLFVLSSSAACDLDTVADEVIVVKSGELVVRENLDNFKQRTGVLVGHGADVDRFLSARPDLEPIVSRDDGATREVVLDHYRSVISDAELAAYSLSTHEGSFQEALTYVVQEAGR